MIEESGFGTNSKNSHLLEATPIAYQSLDNEGRILEVNEAWLQELGYRKEEVLGRWFFEFIYPSAIERFKQTFKEFQQSEKLINKIEFPLLKKSGDIIHADYTIRLEKDNEGNFSRSHCIFNDVTEQIRAEKTQSVLHRILEAALKTENLYQLLDVVRDELSQFINVDNMYLALYEAEDDTLYFPYQHDNKVVYPSLPAHKKLTGYVIKTGKSLYADEKTQKILYDQGKIGKADKGTEAKIWIGVPLKSAEKTIGAICLQSYDNPKAYMKEDMHFLEIISDTIALAIIRKQSDDALIESELKFRTLYDNTTVGLYRTTPDGRVILANSATLKLLGYDSFDEMAARNLEEESHYQNYNREEFKNKLEKDGIVTGLESVWKNRFGEKLYVRESAKAVCDDNGKIIYYDGVFEDITDKRQMQKALLESQERLSLALESAGLGLWDKNYQTGKVYRNEIWAKMLGYDLEEIEENSEFFINLIHPDDLEHFKELYEKAERGESFKFELDHRIRTKDGKWKWIYDWGRIVERDKKGNPLRAIGTHLDISHLKETESELRKHQEHISLINSILRHDISNTFSVIKSALNIYRKNQQENILDEADIQIKKGISLINRMKDLEEFFLSLSGLLKMRLSTIINDIAFSYFDLDIEVNGDAEILADEALVSVFDNLFSNAVKHGKADKIKIDITKKNNLCTISVADNGVGILDEIKEQIFDKAFKSGKSGNTGLGLYIIRKTIDRYNGKIYVEDNLPRGTKFIIELKGAIS